MKDSYIFGRKAGRLEEAPEMGITAENRTGFSRNDAFAMGVERLVDPVTVGTIHFLQGFTGMLPKALQRSMVTGGSRQAPYMGFVVEPYAFFVFYEVADFERASSLLPDGFHLAKSRVFDGDEEGYFAILSFFRVHTSAFWGARCEFYLVAENEETGLLSWVIVDYLSDTLSYDRASGLRAPSAPGMVASATWDGRVVVDVPVTDVAFAASLEGSRMRTLDERLWVEGNTSIGYGRLLSDNQADLFALTFPSEEMARALEVPLGNLELLSMGWFSELLAPAPAKLACFPFSQHVLSDSPGQASRFASRGELDEAARAVDFSAMKAFSVEGVHRAMIASSGVSTALVVGLAALALFG